MSFVSTVVSNEPTLSVKNFLLASKIRNFAVHVKIASHLENNGTTKSLELRGAFSVNKLHNFILDIQDTMGCQICVM